MPEFVDYRTAASAAADPSAQWEKAKDRLVPGCWPEIKPGFALDQGAKVFTLGSCFARNIEGHLERLGFDVPMQRFAVPPAEFPARPNGILNKYTPPSIFQELRWVADIEDKGGSVAPEDCEKFCYRLKNGLVIDNGLSGFNPVTYERFLERRRQVFDVVRHAFSAQCVVITPGLTEAWFDTVLELYIQKAPVSRHLAPYQSRIKFVELDFTTCLKFSQATIDLVRARNPLAKFLITTSPVPLARTFSGRDVIVANTHSKSVLRAVCGEIAMNNSGVDYFPSYENVMLTRDWSVFEDDLLHVSEAFVGKIVARLADTYFANASAAARDFQGSFALADEEEAEGLGKAIDLAHRAHEAEPSNDDFAIRLADLLNRAGRHEDAAAVLGKALARCPDRVDALRTLADIQDGMGKSAQAVETLRRVIALDPEQPEPFARLGAIHNRLGDHKSAFAALSQALSINARCAEAHFQMAVLHENCGFPGAALHSLRKARKIEGDQPRHAAIFARCEAGTKRAMPIGMRAANPGLAYYAGLMRGTAKRTLKSLRTSFGSGPPA